MPKCASLEHLVRAFGFFFPRNTVGFQAMGQPWAHGQVWRSLEGQQAEDGPICSWRGIHRCVGTDL